MTTEQLIARFGGPAAIMQITGASRQTMQHWLERGIPYRHHAALIDAARKRRIRGVTLASLAATRPKNGKANGR